MLITRAGHALHTLGETQSSTMLCKTIRLLLPLLGGASPQFGDFPNFDSEHVEGKGLRQFSNFVDLPSQRLQEAAGGGEEGGRCAVMLKGANQGQCITYQAVSEMFHRAASNLPFMPLKLPVDLDSNEEVELLSSWYDVSDLGW